MEITTNWASLGYSMPLDQQNRVEAAQLSSAHMIISSELFILMEILGYSTLRTIIFAFYYISPLTFS